MCYEIVIYPKRKRHSRVRGWSRAFWEPLERKKKKTKCIYIYSRPYRGEKKCAHFSSPRKKGTFGGLGGAQGARWLPATEMGLTSGQPWVNVRSTFGQPSVSSLAIPGYVKPGVNVKTGISCSEHQPLGSAGKLKGSIY